MPSIIVLTETLLPDDYTTTYNIEGYNRISKGRAPNMRGGGLLVYVRTEFEIERLEAMEIPEEVAENIVVLITNAAPKVYVSAIYRPPNGDESAY